jgi:hypothetical protein
MPSRSAAPAGAGDGGDIAALRAHLTALARRRATTTYREAARALGLRPPHTIHRVAAALEALMRADHAAGRPLLSALVLSRARDGLPAPGFFALARELGRYDGPDDAGPAARAFHLGELERAWAEWGRPR